LPGRTKEDRELKYRYIFQFVAESANGRRFSEIWHDARKRHLHMGKRLLSRTLKRYCSIGFMDKVDLRYVANPSAQFLSSRDRSLHYVLKDPGPEEASSVSDAWAEDHSRVRIDDPRGVIQPELAKLYLRYVSFLSELLAKPGRQAAEEATNRFINRCVNAAFSRMSSVLWNSRAHLSRSKLEVLYREDSFPFHY